VTLGGHSWPVRLAEGELVLRPLRHGDARAWRKVRAANAAWLAPWEATSPDSDPPPRGFGQMVRSSNRAAREGTALPLAVEVEGRLAGQVSVAIIWGSLRSGSIGYWVDRALAGQGITPTAVAMVTDHCLFSMGLHRVEVNIRPENEASLRVVHKLGFRDEGVRERYLHIDGGWRDHRSFALTVDDVPSGLLGSWRELRGAAPG